MKVLYVQADRINLCNANDHNKLNVILEFQQFLKEREKSNQGFQIVNNNDIVGTNEIFDI